MGLFHHLPALADSGNAEAELKAHYQHGAMDLLMKNPAPVRSQTVVNSNQKQRTSATQVESTDSQLPFDRVC